MFHPTASIPVLQQRARLMHAAREFFIQQGYWEVETPLLSADVCVDAWLDPFAVIVDPRSPPRYLQTSPEFAMKRLLAAGADDIFQITRSFRRGERGRLHNPEFTLLEWYRVGVTYHAQMDLTEKLVRHVASVARGLPGAAVDLPNEVPRLSYDEAFERFAGTRVLPKSTGELAELARERGLPLPPGIEEDRDGLLNLLLAELVEPHLRKLRVVFLIDYPASQAALARVRPDAPPVAERFELYLDGMEICNGYQELTDPHELRRRSSRHNDLRRHAGKDGLPEHSRLIEAMESGLPECSGVALGFDRLAMWCLGCGSIDDVLAFPLERA